MSSDTRRDFLNSFGLLFLTVSTGCSSYADGSSTGASSPTDRQTPTDTQYLTPTGTETKTTDSKLQITTPASGECTPTDRPIPTSTPGGLSSRSYPSFPETSSKQARVEFAVSYERTLQYNRYITEHSHTNIKSLSVQNLGDGSPVEYADGLLVPVDGEVSASHDGVLEDNGFGAWFYVTDTFALRHEADGNITRKMPKTFTPSQVVGCV